jgi:hypothetical protein
MTRKITRAIEQLIADAFAIEAQVARRRPKRLATWRPRSSRPPCRTGEPKA